MYKNKLLLITILVSMAGNNAIQTAERSYSARVPKDPALIILKNYLEQSKSLDEAINNFSTFFSEFSSVQLSDQDARGILRFIQQKFPESNTGLIPDSTLLERLLAKPLPNAIRTALEYRKKVSEFIDAAYDKNLKKLSDYLAHGMDVNVRDLSGYTALAVAATTFNAPLAELLLQHGANPNIPTNHNSSPLTIIFSDHYYENNPARIKIADLLFKTGADVDHKGSQGDTALIRTMQNSSYVQLLLQKGACPNIANNIGLTPLMHAAQLHGYEQVESLLKAGANPMLMDKNGKTALDYIDQACRSMESYLPRNAQGYKAGYVEGHYQNCDRIHNLIQSHMKQKQ
jgi:ankyrin repeat protein